MAPDIPAMRTFALLLWIAELSLVANAAHAGEEGRWRLELGQLSQGIDGEFVFGDPGPTNAPLDVESTLDMDRSAELSGWLELRLGGRHALGLGYQPVDFDGSTLLAANTFVLGIPFAAGDRVESQLEFDRIDLEYRFAFRPHPWLRLSPGLRLAIVDGSFDVQDIDTGAATGEDLTAPVPLPGLLAELLPHERLRLFADARGFAAGSWGEVSDAAMWEVEAGVTVRLTRNVELEGTVRLLDLDFEVSDTSFDLATRGAFIGLALVY